MIEIHFQRKEDAKPLYQLLIKKLLPSLPDNPILLDEERLTVKIITEALTSQAFDEIKQLFYQFIIHNKCDDWFRTIITEQFYYSDEEEIQQILEIIHSILEGERKELAFFLKDSEEKTILKHAINHVLKRNISFSFDSFVKFRLREFCARLEKYVELSIDEYKMEQEYQMFIHTLRNFISARAPLVKSLHILVDDDVMFFNEQFVEIKRIELTKMIDRKLLFNHPVYVDSTTIAPLLSIAPESIYLYSKEPEQPLIRTIRNIFEERVLIDSLSVFKERRHQSLKD
ncbi:putative sporulation protein YtxC [Neobacillus sp. LXY-4]|uniref:putative sporulation protein YtxC n=1 Tax=Neobacillus sp. LXY-4 TaxID=3379826 RepID=UPI003EE3280F